MQPEGESRPVTAPVAVSAEELGRIAGPLFTLLMRSGLAMAVTDPRLPDNPIVFANDAFTVLTGYRADEALGRNCRFLQGAGTDPATVAAIGEALRNGREVSAEIQNVRKDGTGFWNRLSIVPVPGEAGEPAFFLSTQVDCSERHDSVRTEDALQQKEAELRSATERLNTTLSISGAAAAWEWRIADSRIEGDSRFAALYGLSPEEAAAGVTPATFFSIIHPQDQPRIRLAVGAVLRGAELFAKEFRILVHGAVRWVKGRGRCHADGQDRPVRFSGVLIDITEQKIVEEQLRIAQTAGGIGTFSYVDGFATASVSAQFCKLLGLQASSALPVRTINAVADPQEPPIIAVEPAIQPGMAKQTEIRIRRPVDRQERWIACRGEYALDSESAAFRFTGVIYDVTDAKRTERALRDLNETLESRIEERTRERDQIWQASSDLLCVADRRGFLVSLNPAWTALLGWSEEELRAVRFLDFVHPDDRDRTAAAAAVLFDGQPQLGFENRCRHKDGSYRWFSWNAVPRGGQIYAVIRDVTAMKEQAERARHLEEQLRQSQKMEAVGQLTGGLAHDFNNLLTGITGSLELLQTRVAQGRLKEADRYVTAAQGAARRAAALTHRLLAFSRRQTLAPKPTDINRLVSGIMELIERTVGPEIAVETVAAGGLWNTLVDPSQLENALLNLCINARDAMPEGGKLTIETANRQLDQRAADERELPAGQYVSLCVSDNGTGMTPEVIARAFDPFFTTKPIGMGTGLGLSMIYGFARQSGGHVRIYSEVGQGATVCIYLPRSLDAAERTDMPASIVEAPRAERGESVLVVDDEPTVRMLVAETLEDLGYRAIEASDGAAGLEVLRSDAHIDLLVTDVGLPGGMNGRQMAHAARDLRPDLKVLFITGYAENAVLNHGHLDPDTNVLTKPFAMEELASRIKELIGKG